MVTLPWGSQVSHKIGSAIQIQGGQNAQDFCLALIINPESLSTTHPWPMRVHIKSTAHRKRILPNTLLMQSSSITQTGPTPLPHIAFANVMDAVTALTAENLNRLATIAKRRLDRLAALPPGKRLRSVMDPMEFVSEAVHLVLLGEVDPKQGRRTKPRHLENMSIFLNYLQAVVQSCISNQLKATQRQGEHVSLDESDLDSLATSDVAEEISQRETLGELFDRLRKRSQDNPALLASVALWENEGADSDRIPKGELSDKQVHRIRAQAKEILRRMAARDGISQPSGREMFTP